MVMWKAEMRFVLPSTLPPTLEDPSRSLLSGTENSSWVQKAKYLNFSTRVSWSPSKVNVFNSYKRKLQETSHSANWNVKSIRRNWRYLCTILLQCISIYLLQCISIILTWSSRRNWRYLCNFPSVWAECKLPKYDTYVEPHSPSQERKEKSQ